MRHKPRLILIALAWLIAACGQTSSQPGLQIVATTSILADVVTNVAGEAASVHLLIPNGTDPHAFEPAPRDVAIISEADLIFINGLGLEEFMQSLLNDAGGQANVVSISERVPTIEFSSAEHDHEDEHESEAQSHEHVGADPHVWMNPQNVKVWVANIVAALSEADPQNSASYRANGEAYVQELDELDRWAREQIAQIAPEARQLVTDHESFGYFAEHYGFEIIGALIPSYSTLSEPSAGELAELEEALHSYAVRAVFVGVSVNPNLAERVAADTGVNLVPVYTESLSEGEPAGSYLDLMRYDIEAIVSALR